MAGARTLKTSFTAGEVAPELLGRPDLRAWANGARRLRNVFIQPTGGLVRRPVLGHVASLPGPARLIAFEFNTEQTYLLALTAGEVRVFVGDAEVARVPGPWSAAMLPQLAHTRAPTRCSSATRRWRRSASPAPATRVGPSSPGPSCASLSTAFSRARS